MSEKHKVIAPSLCDLSDELGGRFFHRLCIGAKRDVLVLSAAKPLSVTAGRNRDKMQFRVYRWHNGELQEFDLPSTPQVYYSVQAVGDNYLCMASRCAPEERNAHLFSARGDWLGSWHAGDGIADVQISPDGKIWVSYFDEGVFSGSPIGAQGLVCFDSQGKLLFAFRKDCPSIPEECDGMADCYALNVASNRDTWLCYYTKFPLVHLRDLTFKEMFSPPPEMIGTHAFAVCGWRRLFVGGYKFRNRLFWRDEASKRQVEIEVVDENGAPLTWERAHGRGADLFLCSEAKVHTLSLNEIGL